MASMMTPCRMCVDWGCTVTSSNGLLVTVLTGWTHGPLGLRDAGWVKVGREVPGAFNLYR